MGAKSISETLKTQRIRLVMSLRQAGVTNSEIISAFERVPRDVFVPPTFRERSYDGTALPIGLGQTISDPNVVARMISALGIGKRLKVLEVGTGSGFQTAILSHLYRRVYSIERHASLLAEAEARLEYVKCFNVTTQWGDGKKGWPIQSPFDRIIVAASAENISDILLGQLGDNGVMVTPVGPEHGVQKVVRIVKKRNGVDVQNLFDVRFLPLIDGLPDNEQTTSD